MEVFQKVAREISTHLHMVFFEVSNVETRDIHTWIFQKLGQCEFVTVV
jgi:hypothetical protein